MVIQVFTYFLTLYFLAGMGTSMGYHRILTHQSAVVPKWFEHLLVCIGLPAGTPIQWVGNHRAHHGYTDVDGDPHSPHLSGFWYAHCGWYIQSSNPFLCFIYAFGGPLRMVFDAFWRPRTNLNHIDKAIDISSQPFYKLISKPVVYQALLLVYAFCIVYSAFLIFGNNGYWISWLSMVIIYNIGDSVDSFGHMYGQKSGVSEARNNRVLGLLSFGDGWHSNHHNNPTLAKHGQKPGQFDLSFLMLSILKKVGLVKKIN